MIRIYFPDKTQKELWLPSLFDLFYCNMQLLAPTDAPIEREKQLWLKEVSPAIDRPARKIIMGEADGQPVGFIMYYVRQATLVIEELQIKKEYQGTLFFYRLCRFLAQNVPADVEFLDAYAVKNNFHSQKIMTKLGMELIEDDVKSHYGNLLHFYGKAEKAKKFFLK